MSDLIDRTANARLEAIRQFHDSKDEDMRYLLALIDAAPAVRQRAALDAILVRVQGTPFGLRPDILAILAALTEPEPKP